MQRTDDSEEIVRERLKVFQDETSPLVQYYQKSPTFFTINGNLPLEQVSAQIRDAVTASMGAAPRRAANGCDPVIVCKSPAELEKMHAASQLVAEVLAALAPLAVAGATTMDIDREAERLVRAAGAVPAFKGYRGFPATVCASLNDAVIHGIPTASRKLREGDILSIDMGVKLNGYYGDSAITVGVGRISAEAYEAPGGDAGSAGRGDCRGEGRRAGLGHRPRRAEIRRGATGIRWCASSSGHGIGAQLHEEPQVPNYGPPGRGPRLAEGMTLAIEPMVNIGKAAVKVLSDGWTAVTVDGSLSAHFEHTVAVTANGPWVMTALPARRQGKTTAGGRRTAGERLSGRGSRARRGAVCLQNPAHSGYAERLRQPFGVVLCASRSKSRGRSSSCCRARCAAWSWNRGIR